jgi:hypothetical protein
MLKDGTYSAWIKTPSGEGTAIIHLQDGVIWGRDSIHSYSGTYEVAGGRFTATVKTSRHSPGQPSLLGVDETEVTYEGFSSGTIATCSGTFGANPGMLVEVILIPNQAQAPETERPIPEFNPNVLPRLTRRSR